GIRDFHVTGVQTCALPIWSVFCPPEAIARDEPYCLFLDELNAASPDVQKAFYSLILDRRIGGYELPAGSIVIGAGNRATDNALEIGRAACRERGKNPGRAE